MYSLSEFPKKIVKPETANKKTNFHSKNQFKKVSASENELIQMKKIRKGTKSSKKSKRKYDETLLKSGLVKNLQKSYSAYEDSLIL